MTDALRGPNKKYAAAAATASEATFATQSRSLPVYKSGAVDVAQVVHEDEDEEAIKLKSTGEANPAASPPKPVAVSTIPKQRSKSSVSRGFIQFLVRRQVGLAYFSRWRPKDPDKVEPFAPHERVHGGISALLNRP